MLPLPLFIFMCAYGLLSLVFAFVEPPPLVSSFFRVPRILVFLPDRWIMPVGRVLVGLLVLGGMGMMYLRSLGLL